MLSPEISNKLQKSHESKIYKFIRSVKLCVQKLYVLCFVLDDFGINSAR